MLTPKRMSKLTLAGPKTVMEKVIRELHKRKIVHIIDHTKDDIDIGAPLEKSDKLSEISVRVDFLISNLKIKKQDINAKSKESTSEIDRISNEIYSNVTEKLGSIKSTEEKLTIAKVRKQTLEKIQDLSIPLESYTTYSSIVYSIGYVNEPGKLRNELEKVTKKFDLHITSGKKPVIVLFIDSHKKEEASQQLSKHNFSELDISSLAGMKGLPQEHLQKLVREEESLIAKKNKLQNQLENISKKWSHFLISSEELLSKELERLHAPLRFAATKNTFVIKGWVPEKRLSELQDNLNKITKKKIFIQTEEIKKDEKIPIELDNPKEVKSFEFFMDIYTMPNYKELDPTFFIFLIFPLLFGFMLGDFGYGLITLVVALLLKKKLPKFHRFFDVFVYSSLTTMFFGALFGEVFGEEVLFGVALPHILSRAHELDTLLGISIIIGILHLLMGQVIGFVNTYREHGIKHAIYEKLGWILLFPGLTKLMLTLELIKEGLGNTVNLILPSDIVIIALTIIGIIIIIKGEGAMGLIELPGIFGNTLSYARLMAIGLASVMLALVVNQYAKVFFKAGGFMIIAGILLLIVGHTINILLGWLGCFLHSLRLHYVEFFTKFFKGGAKRFHPFGLKN
ncbi:MAG: V-type ATP synthase subunit I [Nanoarchaeota archaeon]|nr:V-type ATP synthase subunit I [Nanoarchaeota archaeon]